MPPGELAKWMEKPTRKTRSFIYFIASCDWGKDDSGTAIPLRTGIQIAEQQQAAKAAGTSAPRMGKKTTGHSKKVGCDMHFTVKISVLEPYVAQINIKKHCHVGHGPDLLTNTESCNVPPEILKYRSQSSHISSDTREKIEDLLLLKVAPRQIVSNIQHHLMMEYEVVGATRESAMDRIAAAGKLRDYFITTTDVANIKNSIDRLTWAPDPKNDGNSIHI